MFTDDKVKPRHLSTGKCLCQFIEEHFRHEELDEVLEPAASQPLASKSSIGGQVSLDMVDSVGPVEARKLAPAYKITSNYDHSQSGESLALPFDCLVPTLSHLVSLKERQEQLKVSLDSSRQLDSSQSSANNNNVFSSKLIHGFTTHLQQERLEASSSPTTELSLDLADSVDLFSPNNDELMRKLKSLLDSRKNEFSRALDSASTNAIAANIGSNSANNNNNHNNINNSCFTCTTMNAYMLGANPFQKSDSTSSNIETIHKQQQQMETPDEPNSGNNPISQLGKKFFSQTDGILFLSTKRSQHSVHTKQQQVLEIC